jgi:hypothetical protein
VRTRHVQPRQQRPFGTFTWQQTLLLCNELLEGEGVCNLLAGLQHTLRFPYPMGVLPLGCAVLCRIVLCYAVQKRVWPCAVCSSLIRRVWSSTQPSTTWHSAATWMRHSGCYRCA